MQLLGCHYDPATVDHIGSPEGFPGFEEILDLPAAGQVEIVSTVSPIRVWIRRSWNAAQSTGRV